MLETALTSLFSWCELPRLANLLGWGGFVAQRCRIGDMIQGCLQILVGGYDGRGNGVIGIGFSVFGCNEQCEVAVRLPRNACLSLSLRVFSQHVMHASHQMVVSYWKSLNESVMCICLEITRLRNRCTNSRFRVSVNTSCVSSVC